MPTADVGGGKTIMKPYQDRRPRQRQLGLYTKQYGNVSL